jgi:hypothetical protein
MIVGKVCQSKKPADEDVVNAKSSIPPPSFYDFGQECRKEWNFLDSLRDSMTYVNNRRSFLKSTVNILILLNTQKRLRDEKTINLFIN